MKYNYKPNYKSLLIYSIVNLLLLLPLIIFLLIANLFFNINATPQQFISLIYIIFVLAFYKFKKDNYYFISLLFRLKHFIFQNNTYKIYTFNTLVIIILNFLFSIFTISYFCTNLFNSGINSNYDSNITGIIGTIVSIALTLIFALMQYITDKHPDYLSILEKIKRQATLVFLCLMIYVVIIVIPVFDNDTFALFLNIFAFFLLLTLLLTTINAIILFNPTNITFIKAQEIKKIIVQAPNLISKQEVINKVNDITTPTTITKLKRFVQNNVIGIVKEESNNQFKDFFDNKLKLEIEIIIRTIITNIENNHFNLYTCNIKELNDIFKDLIEKTRGEDCFFLIEYIVVKQKILLDIIIHKKREEYLDELQISIFKSISSLIDISQEPEYIKLINSACIKYTLKEYITFILKIAHFVHSTTACTAIKDIKKFSYKLINKKAKNEIIVFLDEFYRMINTIKANPNIMDTWKIELINCSAISILNTLFYMYSDYIYNKKSFVQSDVLENISKQFIKIIVKNNLVFLSNNSNTMLETYKKIVEKNCKIKTPYKNLVLNGAIKQFEQIYSLSDLFTIFLLIDIDKNTDLRKVIYSLTVIIKDIKSLDYLPSDGISNISLFSFYANILDSLITFTKRIKYFDCNNEEITELLNILIEEYFNTLLVNFQNFYELPNYSFVEDFSNFLEYSYFSVNEISNNTFKSKHIYLLKQILNLYQNEQENPFEDIIKEQLED